MVKGLLTLTVIFIGTSSFRAQAYFENIRHGYQSCATCHVSPNGGGALNDYGRALSSDVMSTWGSEATAQFAHGIVELPVWLKVGGDIRAVQTYFNSPTTTSGSFFLMQDTVEFAAILGQVTFVGDIGTFEGPNSTPGKGTFISQRHYVLFRPTDEVSVRAGKFEMQYGINDPNHLRAVRQGLIFGPYSETDNLEFAYQTDTFNAFLTADLGRIEDPGSDLKKRYLSSQDVEKGVAASFGYFLSTKSTVGTSFYLGENASLRRELQGLYTLLAITQNFFWQGEVDLQELYDKSNSKTTGVFSTQKLGYEITKGVIPYLIHDLAFANVDLISTRSDAYGVGFQFFPYPHIEFQTEYQKQRIMQAGDYYADYGWIMGHYYF